MNTRIAALAFVLAAGSSATACDMATEPETPRIVGIIAWESGARGSLASAAALAGSEPEARIAAPDTVQAGVPFQAVVTTVGLAGCWREAGSETEAHPALAVVTPYDYAPNMQKGTDIACTGDLKELPRAVEVRFTEPGTAILRVSGRKLVGDNYVEATSHTLEKRIHVR